nr:MAG TPA: hypothetical protein [Caudoviricetes sp.]
MIDVERMIFTPIAEALRKKFKGIDVSGAYVKSPPKFPHASIVEQDNYTTTLNQDSSGIERFATIMYEVNVYSNKTGESKSECRSILSEIDKMLYAMNFTRIAMTPVPNMDSASIYRLVARYRAETDGKKVFRR